MYRSKIIGSGFYVPPKVVTNDDLGKLMETSDEWIYKRTGIKERHFIERDGIGSSDLAYEASKKAIADAGLTVDDIDFIVFATLSPDFSFPGSGVLLQHKLGGKKFIGAVDIRTQCTGFIYAISIADNFIKTGQYKNILVVGAEVHSTGMNFSKAGRDVSVLFGDGAGAVVLSRSNGDNGILSTHLYSQGEHYDKLWVESPASRNNPRITKKDIDEGRIYPIMDGQFVFKHAVKRMKEVVLETLEKNNLKIEDVSLIVPHQANLRINQMVARQLKIPDNKMFNNIDKYGNTTAATIPIALTEALQQGLIHDGDLVIMVSFGSGFTWGAVTIRW